MLVTPGSERVKRQTQLWSQIGILLTLYPLRRTAVFPKSVNTDSLCMYNIPFKSY